MIQLLLKSPNQQIDDVRVECDSKWTVENLKDYLCNEYPTKPAKNQQKIIYGGRLLPDHLLIKDVVTRDQDVHIMHLVCPQSTSASKTNGETSKAKEEEVTNVVGPSPLPNIFGTPMNAEGLRQRVFDQQQYMSNLNNLYSQAQFQPQAAAAAAAAAMPVASMYNAYQLASMQQTYAQFMTQFLTQGQPSFQMPNPGITMPNQPAAQPNVNQPAANRQRLFETDDRRERFDLIDSLYAMTRLAMLFIVLYFYSSPGRILVVLSFIVLFLLYRVNPRRRQAENPPPVAGANQNTRPPQPNNPASESTTDQTESQSEENIEQEENPPSKLETVLVFVKTLFTSLIPDQPLPVDVN